MANTFFQFKQFLIHQDKCAMKIGVDSVLLGAWCDFSNARRILDIGTGTGVLALMAAQKNHLAMIDAVEINTDAAQQAKVNFECSPWSERLHVECNTVQEMAKTSINLYDVIVSNPPYFVNGIKSTNADRANARHNDTLSIADLMKCVDELLNEKGDLYIIIPYPIRSLTVQETLRYQLHLVEQLNVYSIKNQGPKRVLMKFSRLNGAFKCDDFYIHSDSDNSYSSAYKDLTQDFYL